MTLDEQMKIIESHQKSLPIQTVPIARDLGIEVYSVRGWPDNISGRIFKSDERGGSSGYAIEVNAEHARTRRRFTIAHEVAHFVLHKEQIGDGVYDDAMYRSGLTSSIEREANRLAADILMPWHLLRPIVHGRRVNVASVAETFDVSEYAMSVRLGIPFYDP